MSHFSTRSFLIAFCASAALHAQDRAVISGTVMDPTRAAIAGASIELKSDVTGLHRSVV